MKKNIKKLVTAGFMSTLTLISTFLQIKIPIGNVITIIHLGNVFCILSGFLLGPLYGGIAAGTGSFWFDILNPNFVMSAPFTFVFKFIIAFICGKIAPYQNKNTSLKYIFASILGSATYILLHLVKAFIFNHFLFKMTSETNTLIIIKSAIVSVINAVISITISVFLIVNLNPILKKYNFFK